MFAETVKFHFLF